MTTTLESAAGVQAGPAFAKAALDPRRDAETIRQLERVAIAHRRRLLELGQSLRIRLHYGASMSCVEILTLLYQRWLRVDPHDPGWDARDRFVLSKGHAAPSLYVALALRGFFPDREFERFRTLGSILQGHPDRNKTPGVDCTTGSLGQGFPVACGMALGAKIDRAHFRVYALVSDGECNEGSVWEAALLAANQGLDRLTALVDWNRKSSYGPMQGRNDVEPLADKWRAFGWRVFECDGHDFADLSRALAAAEEVNGQPSVLLCHTTKGKGIPYAESHETRSNFALTAPQFDEAFAHLAALESSAAVAGGGA
jgi:transketolase